MSRVRRIGGGSLRSFRDRVQAMTVSAAQIVASQAAPELTAAARADFDSGLTAYGAPRPSGVNGPLSLVATGATRATLGFSSQGTVMRAVLTTPWAKYLVGKYQVLPSGDRTDIPPKWKRSLDGIVARVLASEWKRAA